MTEYYILAWLSFYYALVVLSALVGFWIRNKYFKNEKITQIEYGIVSEKPILCKMIASNEENKQASEIIIWFYALQLALTLCDFDFFRDLAQSEIRTMWNKSELLYAYFFLVVCKCFEPLFSCYLCRKSWLEKYISRVQLYTSLEDDLHQGFEYSWCIKGTFPWM